MNERDITGRQIEAAIWYIKHKALLRRVAFIVIGAIDALLIVFVLFGYGRDILLLPERRAQELDLLKTTIASHGPALVSAVQQLELGGVELIRTGDVTDVIARVRNPNPDWRARFSYSIGMGDKTITISNGFLLPLEERPFFHSVRGGSGEAIFTIERLRWHRIDTHEIVDFVSWQKERLQFEINDVRFIPSLIEGKGIVSRAQFTVVNTTGYGYYAPTFLVVLYQGSRVVGIQSVVLNELKSGQVRPVEVSWFDRVSAVSKVEVLPVIDILDPGVYLKPGA